MSLPSPTPASLPSGAHHSSDQHHMRHAIRGTQFIAGVAVALITAAALPAADVYRFPSGRAIAYRYDVDQTLAMVTAGDHLDLTTRITWYCTLESLGESAQGRPVDIRLAIQRLTVIHKSPGSSRIYDSSIDSTPDPDLVGYKAMVGATLVLTLDPTTGRVSKASGGDRLATAIGRLAPNQVDPSAPSAIAIAARAVYRDEALARLWSGVLALPSPGRSEFPASVPLSGAMIRTWSGNAWTGILEPAQQTITLENPPLAATGSLQGFTGQGSIHLADGLPQNIAGTMDYALHLTVMTQPVVQQHHISWSLQRQP